MITITGQTRISEIIKANKDSIEVIAAMAKPLEKLRNPLLRRLMAPRVTLAEAAAIGGCDLEALQRALQPLGFRIEAAAVADEVREGVPKWLQAVPPDKILTFDVRPLMSRGEDPLKAIVAKFRERKDGEVLCIVNSFVPYPLINLFAKESLTYTHTLAPDEYHTWFLKRYRPDQAAVKAHEKIIMEKEKSFGKVLAAFPEIQVRRIDVRHLEMPLPMQTILEALDELPAGHVLYVYHKKVPVYLLEELADKRFTSHILELSEGEVRLLIYANR